MELEKEKFPLRKLDWILRIALIVLVALILFMLVWWAQSDMRRYDAKIDVLLLVKDGAVHKATNRPL